MIKSAVERSRQVLDDSPDQSTESEIEGQGGAVGLAEKSREIAEKEEYYSGKAA